MLGFNSIGTYFKATLFFLKAEHLKVSLLFYLKAFVLKDHIKPQIYCGTSGWSYQDWKGKFYPEKLSQAKWFGHYAQTFNSVEVNATFYRWFEEKTYQNWQQKAPEGFKYVIKLPRGITHQKLLKEIEDYAERFEGLVAHLGNKLGMLLMQLPPKMPYNPERIDKALSAFKHPEKLAVEFRSAEFFTEEISDILKKHGATFCIVDSPDIKPIPALTSKTAYLRFHGHTEWYKDSYSPEQLENFKEICQNLIEQGAEKLYLFFNNNIGGHAPFNAQDMMNLTYELKNQRI